MSDDFLVTHVCPECNHIWLYPNVFDHACPSCGTTNEPISVELLAGRREKRARGEDLTPLVIVPDKDTPMHAQFTEGVRLLRNLLEDMEAQAQRLTDYGDNLEAQAADENDPYVKAAYGAAKEARNQVGRLRAAERKISALFILGDDAESFAGIPVQRADASTFADMVQASHPVPPIEDGAPCPHCPGTLKAMARTPIYLTCNSCGSTFTKNDPVPLVGPEAGAFTGEIVENGPPLINTDEIAKRWSQNISHQADERIADQLRAIDTPADRLRRSRRLADEI